MASHPIFNAVFHGDLDSVRTILTDDASSINLRNAKDLTPLHVAASRGQQRVIELLLDHGAPIDGPTAISDWPPVVFASYRGHFDAVRVLVERGAGLKEADGNPIHFAAQRKHKDICRLLVEHGAVDDLVKTPDPDILTLFRAAYSYDSTTINKVLAGRPQLVHSRDRNKRTLLHEAATGGDTKTVRTLLAFGCDARAKDANHQTALDRAKTHRQHDVVKLLQQALRTDD